MKSIQDMKCVAGPFGHYPQIGFPHVAADEVKPSLGFRAKVLKEAPEGLLCPLPTYPEKSSTSGIDLINQRQVFRALAPGDLIDADRRYVFQVSMCQPPGHGHLHRAEDIMPGSPKGLGRLFPTQSLTPVRQDSSERGGQMVLPLRPGNMLDSDTATRAINPAQTVKEKNGYSPKGDKFKTANIQGITYPRPFFLQPEQIGRLFRRG
jgi:hypothetical protein